MCGQLLPDWAAQFQKLTEEKDQCAYGEGALGSCPVGAVWGVAAREHIGPPKR